MVLTILAVGSLGVILIFAVALMQTSGKRGRAEEEAEAGGNEERSSRP